MGEEVGQGVSTAVKAAEGIIQADPVLGGICVILALAFAGLFIWHIMETKRLNREMLESERQHGKDALLMQAGVSTALATVQQAMNFMTAKEK